MELEVQHTTHFRYPSPVQDSFNETRLQPVSNLTQERLSFALEVNPAARPGEYRDFYQNVVHYFEVTPPHTELKVTARSRVRTGMDGAAPKKSAIPEPLHDYLQASPFVSLPVEVFREAVDHQGNGKTMEERAVALMDYVNGVFIYEPNVTEVHTHVEDVFCLRRGVCQDLAHAMISMCRLVKIPARYVSGYVYCGDRGEMRGAQASHAWVEVYVGNGGWVGLDPTNRCRVGEMHVKVAHGRDYRDVPPLSGNYHGNVQGELVVTVEVRKV
jgi:transglutaminase-like putative cysteine protease